ncbi:MAG: C40 family peptidase [Saprospiraceae bacterium]|nr:C40 family peptidase [Saprospiraceae bacterium]
MNDTLPSSRSPRINHFRLPLALLLFFVCSAFHTNPLRESRAESAEMMQFREFITGYAQNFIGLKYRYAGVSPKTGFDCSGFTSFVLNEFGVKTSSSSSAQARQGERISLSEVLPGDLIIFGGRGHIQHVAMVVERSAEGIFCVHSTSSRGIIVENILTSRYWKPKILYARDVITEQAEVKDLF